MFTLLNLLYRFCRLWLWICSLVNGVHLGSIVLVSLTTHSDFNPVFQTHRFYMGHSYVNTSSIFGNLSKLGFFNPSETIRMLLTTYPWPFPAGLFLIQLHLQWVWNPTMGSQLDIYTAYSSQSGSIYWCMHSFSPTYQTKAGAYPSCHRARCTLDRLPITFRNYSHSFSHQWGIVVLFGVIQLLSRESVILESYRLQQQLVMTVLRRLWKPAVSSSWRTASLNLEVACIPSILSLNEQC